jgi:hypothetical protein
MVGKYTKACLFNLDFPDAAQQRNTDFTMG